MLLGLPPMLWQQQVFDVMGEYDPATGLPFYTEVAFTVPRQSGKTTISLAKNCHRCLWWPGQPQRVVYTAQTGSDARVKWTEDLFPLLEKSQLARFIQRINKGMGNESVLFKTGGRIRIMSSSKSAGHGQTIHEAVLDELFHDKDTRREQGLRPAMITVPDKQLLVCSTAGTQTSTAWNRKLRQGRKAVREDSGRGMAFFEWSAPDGWDPFDEEAWWSFMPALGRTITPDSIRAELEGMELDDFKRAYGNLTSKTANTLIPLEAWELVTSDGAAPAGDVVFGVDVLPDRSAASIAVASADGVAELIDHRAGTGWVPGRVVELRERWAGRVVRHKQSPAGSLDLPGVEDLGTEEVVRACGSFYDRVVDGDVELRTDAVLDVAVSGAVKKDVGDAWMFSRKSSAEDVTPLLAVAMALHAAREGVDGGGPSVYESRGLVVM